MALLDLGKLAIPGVIILISFLGFTSQILFRFIEPGPLKPWETIFFNGQLAVLFFTYYKACTTDPGRISKDWDASEGKKEHGETNEEDVKRGVKRRRWCRKCDMFKPPRTHHCKVCKRCIPKMDHHCPWTANCVSHTTMPHFVRFLFYAVVPMIYLEMFLYARAMVIWEYRHWPAYLGPSIFQLIHLFALIVTNSITLFALSVLLIRTIWCIGANTTTIEGWEIERHATLVRRAKVLGGTLYGADGTPIHIKKQEFPYDIGIWQNFVQAFGTWFIFAWFWPFSRTLSVESGIKFEVNGFEAPSTTWPPPDPDRIPFIKPSTSEFNKPDDPFVDDSTSTSDKDWIAAFKQRQEADLRRRKTFHQRFDDNEMEDGPGVLSDYDDDDDDDGSGQDRVRRRDEGEEGWRNSEGERLADFGVDEDVEFYDEDSVPLAELIRRRKAQAA